MAVVKEYRCNDPECRRIFDSSIPQCIHCGSTNVKRVFVTPFSFKSDKTKLNDKSIDGLMQDYGMTDFSNNENTKHSPAPSGSWRSPEEVSSTLQQIRRGDGFDVKPLGADSAGQIERMVSSGGVPQE